MLTIREIIKTFYNALLQRFKKYRGNWEQNDPNADDYIKNRPFYTDETSKETVVSKKTFTTTESNEWCNLFLFEPIIGQVYTVAWDEKLYECIAYEDARGTYLGNPNIVGDENNTGEPFFYYYRDNDDYDLCVRSAGAHTIEVSTIKVVKLDKKYLPENFATKSEVETAQTSANRAQAAAESAQTIANNNKETLSTIFAPSVFSFTFDKQTSGRPYFNFNNFTYYKISDFAPAPENVISFIGTNENGENSSKITVGNNCAEYGCFIVVTSAGTCSLPIGGGIYALYPQSTGLYARYPEYNNKSAAGTGKFILQINSSWPANGLLLKSSNPNSTKKFQITVDDNGALTATEVIA